MTPHAMVGLAGHTADAGTTAPVAGVDRPICVLEYAPSAARSALSWWSGAPVVLLGARGTATRWPAHTCPTAERADHPAHPLEMAVAARLAAARAASDPATPLALVLDGYPELLDRHAPMLDATLTTALAHDGVAFVWLVARDTVQPTHVGGAGYLAADVVLAHTGRDATDPASAPSIRFLKSRTALVPAGAELTAWDPSAIASLFMLGSCIHRRRG